MGKRKNKTTPRHEPPATAEKSPLDTLRLGLLAVTVGTFVARPLVTSESAVLGDGLVLVMLLLLLGLIWAVNQARNANARIRFTAIDAAVLLLVGLYCISGLIAIPAGNARSVINMIWLWVGLTSGYFLLRQLIDRAIEMRAIVAVMIALAVAVASHGLYQYCWKFPQMRATYALDPDAMLRAEGMWYPPNSPEREQFDNRINSREPIATFALTNSLAGFLAPWLIVAAGLFLQPIGVTEPKLAATACGALKSPKKRIASNWHDRTKLALMLLILAACFILTKSRTAWTAVALGGLGLGLWWKLRGRTISLKWVVVGAATVLLLVGIAIAAGGLDSQVVDEAGKSLKYRFEYWQATSQMIAEEPWFGTGPGRFQETYSQFKLPEASEQPADPHNFLFEIAATAGLFALATMVTLLVLFVVRLGRRKKRGQRTEDRGQKTEERACSAEVKKYLYLGGLIGYLASFPIGMMGTVIPDGFVYWGALPIGALALLGLDRWVRDGTLSPGLLGIAWGVLIVNLLAAGGISFPGVAVSFWMLLALGVLRREQEDGEQEDGEQGDAEQEDGSRVNHRVAKSVCGFVALATLGLLAACYFTAYGPVLAAQSEQNAATREPCQAEAHLLRAAEADPWSVEPWIQLSNIAYAEWEADSTPERFDRFLRFNQEVLDHNPNKSPAWFFSGERNNEAYRRMRRPTDQERSLAAYRRAVELYPTHSLYRAKWALALQAAGQEADSRREAKKSLDLDRQNPHHDKRLPEPIKELLEKAAS